ncbi:MAG TPA: DUF2267 domain-containing protein [Candidatus Caenarcaniphilales bacterium]
MSTHAPFLEKVMRKGNLKSTGEAKKATEVVFRTLRDVMSTEAVERVEDELDDKPGDDTVEDLWEDTNPLVSFLSRIRPQLKIKSENFLIRLQQEANLPEADPETVMKAVFSATKDELSEARIQEISKFLPDEIQQMWQQA